MLGTCLKASEYKPSAYSEDRGNCLHSWWQQRKPKSFLVNKGKLRQAPLCWYIQETHMGRDLHANDEYLDLSILSKHLKMTIIASWSHIVTKGGGERKDCLTYSLPEHFPSDSSVGGIYFRMSDSNLRWCYWKHQHCNDWKYNNSLLHFCSDFLLTYWNQCILNSILTSASTIRTSIYNQSFCFWRLFPKLEALTDME